MRRLSILHRYAGRLAMFIVAIWFISGAVMIFWRYPRLDATIELAALHALPNQAPIQSPSQLASLGVDIPGDATLQMSPRERAVYVFDRDGRREAIDALSGQPAARYESAELFDAIPGSERCDVAKDVTILDDVDRWTVPTHYSAYLPLLQRRFTDDNGEETLEYWSLRSGEWVQRATNAERFWAYFGAIPHWLYFAPLRQHASLWRYLILSISAFCIGVTAIGWVLGIWRSQQSRRLRARISPFRRGSSLRIHHLAGLVFAPIVLTWLISGAFSLNPFRWTAEGRPDREAIQKAWSGGEPTTALHFYASIPDVLQSCRRALPAIQQLTFHRVGNTSIYRCVNATDSVFTWKSDNEDRQDWQLSTLLPTELIRIGAKRIWNNPNTIIEPLASDDLYVYPHVHGPALDNIVTLKNEAQPDLVLYLDRDDGRFIKISYPRGRVERWLYQGLHRFDFPGLYQAYPVWLGVILGLLAGGFLVSISAIAASLRRSKRISPQT